MWNYTLRHEYRPFKDVKNDTEQETIIRAATLMGLVKGRKSGYYDPNSNISREEAAVMLGRIIHIYGPDLKKISRFPLQINPLLANGQFLM